MGTLSPTIATFAATRWTGDNEVTWWKRTNVKFEVVLLRWTVRGQS